MYKSIRTYLCSVKNNLVLGAIMHVDKEKRIWFSKQEMKVIIGALHVFLYEMWKLERCKEFRSVKTKLPCSMEDLKYVKNWFANLYNECKQDTYIFLFDNAPKKLAIISTALQKCNKHFKEYDVQDLSQIDKEELDDVLKDFQKLFAKIEKVK